MESISDSSDERLKSWCAHCGAALASVDTNRDHVPSKSLLLKPFPTNLPVMPICKQCNQGFSRDEEYLVALLGAILSGSTKPDHQLIPRAAGIFARSPALRARIERAKSEQTTEDGNLRLIWMPEEARVQRVVLKNARGHAFYELGEPMLDDAAHVWITTLESMSEAQRGAFEAVNLPEIWPEVGCRMMSRLVTGQDIKNSWIVVQDGAYRYSIDWGRPIVVRSVIFEYLATDVAWYV